MKQLVKELLDEMIAYQNNIKLPEKHLINAMKEMETAAFAFSTRHILQWLKEVKLKWQSIDGFKIPPIQVKEYRSLFSLSSTFKELFFAPS